MNHLVFIVLLLGLTSCGMQKQVVSQDVQAESRRILYDSTSLDRAVSRIIREAIAEDVKKIITQEVEIDRHIYSEPDSSGRQYVIETQEIVIKSNAQENRILQAEITDNNAESTDSTSVSARVEDLVLNTQAVRQEDGLRLWQKALMLAGWAVLLYIIIRIALKLL